MPTSFSPGASLPSIVVTHRGFSDILRMPTLSIQLYVITQIFEETQECRLGEALFFPEVTCLDDTPKNLRNLVAENGLSLLARVPNLELARRLLLIEPELNAVEVTVEPA